MRKSSQEVQLKGVERVRTRATEMSPVNIEATVESKALGGADLLLRYCGPLADRQQLWVRFGERRDGQDWINPRDVAMLAAKGEATATVACGAGSPLEGACFAFFAQGSGGEDWVWDNAGRSLGYYAFDAKTGKVEAR